MLPLSFDLQLPANTLVDLLGKLIVVHLRRFRLLPGRRIVGGLIRRL